MSEAYSCGYDDGNHVSSSKLAISIFLSWLSPSAPPSSLSFSSISFLDCSNRSSSASVGPASAADPPFFLGDSLLPNSFFFDFGFASAPASEESESASVSVPSPPALRFSCLTLVLPCFGDGEFLGLSVLSLTLSVTSSSEEDESSRVALLSLRAGPARPMC